jgi:riboflavin-specific deaminase-like protein
MSPKSKVQRPKSAHALTQHEALHSERSFRVPRSAFRISHRLPFVFINMAMTADGKIANANRAISSIGSRRDHEHLLELRATADAVMAGARTVDSNPVTMGPGPTRFRRLRLKRGLSEYNLRIIVSGSGSINPRAEVFRHRFSPIIILTTDQVPSTRLKKLNALADQVKVCGKSEIDFAAALNWLREKWNVDRLLCEGGGELNAALFRANLVNELHLTICPTIIGGRNAPTIADGLGASSLPEATRLELHSRKEIGAETFLVFRVLKQLRPARP